VIDRLRMLKSSYRVRIALGYALIVAILAGAWAWSLYGPLTGTVVEQQRTHLASIARAGALALERPGVTASTTAVELVHATTLRATVVAADGTVLADTAEDPARMADHSDRPEVIAALAGRIGYDTRVSATTGTEQMYVAVPARSRTLGGRRGDRRDGAQHGARPARRNVVRRCGGGGRDLALRLAAGSASEARGRVHGSGRPEDAGPTDDR
jgi:hypothetical protein